MANMLTGLELLAQRVKAGILGAGHVGEVPLRLHFLNAQAEYLATDNAAVLKAVIARRAVSCRCQVARTYPDRRREIVPHPLVNCGSGEFLI